MQYLGKFVRERQLVSLKEAIYKMSGFPAERFRLCPTAAESVADLPQTSSFSIQRPSQINPLGLHPVQSPVGVNWVFVNGVSVVKDGNVTGQLPGRVLRQQR